MAERGGFEPPVPLLGVHTISSRAPSTARSPLRYAISRTCRSLPHSSNGQCLQNVSTGVLAASSARSWKTYHAQKRIAKLREAGPPVTRLRLVRSKKTFALWRAYEVCLHDVSICTESNLNEDGR